MPLASIVIVTRNRKETAMRAVRSALTQEGDVEVLVIDDGSTDGTAEFIRQQCPAVGVHRYEKHEGYIVQRTRGGQLARGEFLVSIDDDAEFTDPRVVADAVDMFDADPRIGA